jgi:hypothetical protein
MNTQEFIDKNLRLALGNMHVELILAQARITELEALLAEAAQAQQEAAPPALNGSGKPNGKRPADAPA